MKPKEKNDALTSMKNHAIDMLVATPVVEVGIDIPNASIMLIEAGERYGLSQLHQLRGRVGRSDKQAYCLVFTEATNETAIKRLKSLETTHSGPELAEIDLSIRGPGELFGTRQHGMPPLKFGTLFDARMLDMAGSAATRIMTGDPRLTGFPLLRECLGNSTIDNSSFE
jgi:ATP-dependent DNA helicase RecG